METQQIVEPNAGIRNVSEETDNQMNTLQSQNLIIGFLVILLVLSFLGINILLVLGNFFQAIINIFGPLVYKILGVFGYTAGAVLNKTSDVVSDTTKVGVDIADGTVQSVGNLLIKSSGAVVDPNAKRLLDSVVNTPIRVKLPTPPPVFVPVPVPVAACSPGSFNSLLNNPITRFLTYDTRKTASTTPGSTTPGSTTPGSTTPGSTRPASTTTASTMPASTIPASTIPASTTTASTIPASTIPASTIPASFKTTVPTETLAKIQNPISSNKISWCFAGEYQGKRGCVEVEDQSKCLSGQVFPSQQACLSTTPSSDPLFVKAIVPTMSSTVPNYGNGTMMMNGLPAPPIPPIPPSIQQLQTVNPSIISQQSSVTNLPIVSQQSSMTNSPIISQNMQNAPFLPYIPPQNNPSIIQADGPPLVNGPINYFYTYSDKLGTEKTI